MAKFLVLTFLCMVLTESHLVLAMPEPPKAAAARKLGKEIVLGSKPAVSRLSSAEAPRAESASSAEVSASGEEIAPAGQEEEMEANHHRRHPIDRSVAGGGVIVGGLATAFLVAVFCYIQATRRKSAEPGSPSDSGSTVKRRDVQSGSPASIWK